MIVADGNIQEYNELMKLSIENYLTKFKMFIDKIERINQANKQKKK